LRSVSRIKFPSRRTPTFMPNGTTLFLFRPEKFGSTPVFEEDLSEAEVSCEPTVGGEWTRVCRGVKLR
jgi:hypothetical protein